MDKDNWQWCRDYINDHAIIRVRPEQSPFPAPRSKGPDGKYLWVFQTRRAMFDPDFAIRAGALMWDILRPYYVKERFQLCAVESAGLPVALAMQWTSPINIFSVRKKQKPFGTRNWIEGRPDRDLPVVMIDDMASSMRSFYQAATRVQEEGFRIYPVAAALLRKHAKLEIRESVTLPLMGRVDIVSPFAYHDFDLHWEEYQAAKAGTPLPKLTTPMSISDAPHKLIGG